MFIAVCTGGYVAADLAALMSEVFSRAELLTESSDQINVLREVFEEATRVVTPSCLRGISVKLPRVNLYVFY